MRAPAAATLDVYLDPEMTMRALVATAFLLLICACHPTNEDTPPWIEEHDLTSAALDASTTPKRNGGYRPISISIYGAPADPRFAVVWVHRSGPEWELLHGLSLQALSDAFNARAGQAAVRCLSATDDGTPSFAGIWEHGGDGVGKQSLLLDKVSAEASGKNPYTDAATIEYALIQARRPGNSKVAALADRQVEQRPVALALYGGSFAPRFAVVLQDDPSRTLWNADAYQPGLFGLTNSSDLGVQAGTLKRVGLRPAQVMVQALSGNLRALYAEDPGGEWVLVRDLDASQLGAMMNQQRGLGRLPITLQGASYKAGAPDAHFTAAFAPSELPASRTFAVDGLPKPAANGSSATPQTDAVMKKFMQANGVTQASVAVLKDLHLVAVRQYTNAAPGQPVSSVNTVWRLASMSKLLTAIAIEQLVDEGKLDITRPAQDVLGWKQRSGAAPADPNFAKITVQQLLQHISGIPESTPSPRTIADAGITLSAPGKASQDDLVEYLMTRTITNHPPGNVGCQDTDDAVIHCFQYSNVGYFILARVVEKLRGKPFIDALGDTVFAPLGAKRPRWYEPNFTDQLQDEAHYIDASQGLSPNQMDTLSNARVPTPYGGDLTKLYDGAGALSVHPAAYLKVMAALNVPTELERSPKIVPILSGRGVQELLVNHYGLDWSVPLAGNPTPYVAWKGGYLSGLQSSVRYTQNGLTYVIFWNRNELNFGTDSWWPSYLDLEQAIQTELGGSTDDFFDTF